MIKVTEDKLKQAEVKYPCLKKHPVGTIVLFTDPHSGTLLIKGNSSYDVGDYRTEWTSNFQVIDYPIVLENI